MKRALIVGANSAIAKALNAQLITKYNVTYLSRDNTDYSEASLMDFSKQFKEQGDFHLIINCIGVLHNHAVSPEKRLSHLTATQLTEYFRINTILPALCLRYFAPLLDKRQRSVYINLSAMVGSIEDNNLGGWYGYRSSKAALNMMVKTASIEIKRTNKQACLAVMHPGTTQGALSTPFASSIPKENYYTPEQSAQRIIQVSDRLTPELTGQFFNWDGSHMNW